jgi:hypothetical protein
MYSPLHKYKPLCKKTKIFVSLLNKLVHISCGQNFHFLNNRRRHFYLRESKLISILSEAKIFRIFFNRGPML